MSEDSDISTMSSKEKRKLHAKLKREYDKKTQELAYLFSEEAEEEYIGKAKQLLKTLFDKWSVLADYIEALQKFAAENNVIHGPHGRPRHLWGYFHPDRFVKFAMDRRAFNSVSQGYASDIGYQAIYLMYTELFRFKSQGFDTDIRQCNAVHDSAMSDIPYPMLPLALYLQDHSMTTLSRDYYEDNFKIYPTTLYAMDVDAGQNEAELTSYNKRPDDLAAFVEEVGQKCNIPQHLIDAAKKDAIVLGKLRKRELEGSTYLAKKKKRDTYSLADAQVFQNTIPSLRMWDMVNTYYNDEGLLIEKKSKKAKESKKKEQI